MILKKLSLILVLVLTTTKLFASDNNHQLNFYVGNFDFSDHKQAAILIGFQHQNEDLNRDTLIGNISPITGGFVTENSAIYVLSLIHI